MKNKVFTVVVLCLIPFILFSFINTKSETIYKWWEDVLGYTAIVLLYTGYINWCYSLIFDNSNE